MAVTSKVAEFVESSVGHRPLAIGRRADERRAHRRHDLEGISAAVERWDSVRGLGRSFGEILDISAGGLRVRTTHSDVRPGSQIRIKVTLPVYAGITPFIASDGSGRGTNEWTGWLSVNRVQRCNDGTIEIAGRLVDMREIDRGMLGLYLSAQPLAA